MNEKSLWPTLRNVLSFFFTSKESPKQKQEVSTTNYAFSVMAYFHFVQTRAT